MEDIDFYITELTFKKKSKNKNKIFSDKQKPREIFISRLFIKEVPKGHTLDRRKIMRERKVGVVRRNDEQINEEGKEVC